MDFKKTLLPVALLATLAPLAAFADHDRDFDRDRPSYEEGRERYRSEGAWRNDGNAGRYEVRTVQQWVPGRYEQIWVGQQCWTHPSRWRGEVVRCRPGFYDNRWMPGHYQMVQTQVWVPYRTYPRAQPYAVPNNDFTGPEQIEPVHPASPIAPTASNY